MDLRIFVGIFVLHIVAVCSAPLCPQADDVYGDFEMHKKIDNDLAKEIGEDKVLVIDNMLQNVLCQYHPTEFPTGSTSVLEVYPDVAHSDGIMDDKLITHF